MGAQTRTRTRRQKLPNVCCNVWGGNAEGAPNFSYLVTYNYNVATLH